MLQSLLKEVKTLHWTVFVKICSTTICSIKILYEESTWMVQVEDIMDKVGMHFNIKLFKHSRVLHVNGVCCSFLIKINHTVSCIIKPSTFFLVDLPEWVWERVLHRRSQVSRGLTCRTGESFCCILLLQTGENYCRILWLQRAYLFNGQLL